MKKKICTLSLLLIFATAYAQKNLRLVISAENGVTKHFTNLEESLQVPFNPSLARSTFGLDTNSDLILQNSETDQLGLMHHRYYQTYKGIPVENTMYIVHTSRGRLMSMSGSVVTEFNSRIENRSSTLSAQQAITHALNYVRAEKYAWQDANYQQRIKFRKGSDATYFPVAEKVWYGGDEEINPANLKLAYKVDVYSLKPFDRKYIYVDAQSGEILGTNQILKHADAIGSAATGYSGSRSIHSDYTGSYYRLRDYTKGKGIITLRASTGHGDYKSSSANFSYSTIDKWALDAHFGVISTWRFYKNNFNRNSIDNNGFALISWVNDVNNPDNAYWDGSEMVYGNLSSNGKGVVGIDVVGHELTHGVTERTSGLTYSKEPGAINESMSDIMGKSVQFYVKPADSSWILSNDMGWEIRSLSNPNSRQQPDTYKGAHWITSSADNYGVHTNSGVGNFMFYLLVKGGSGINDIFDACRQGNIEKVKELYEANSAIINAQDHKGFTPLILAVYNEQPSVVDFLLQKKAVLNSPDGSGNSALMGVCFKGYTKIAEKLLDAGAEVNQRNSNGATALTFAATFGHLEIAEMLLKKGADVNVRDARGKSPLDHARIQENWKMYDLLEQYATKD